VEEGIIPGGGVAYLRISKSLEKLKLEGDEAIGVAIIKKALEEPIRLIAENAGHEGSVVVNRVREQNGSFGFNADTEKFEDLYLAGVIDPAKVARIALENAASIASLLLTTEALICEKPDDKKASAGMPPGGGYGGDMY
jgi:chaperonin GroEL